MSNCSRRSSRSRNSACAARFVGASAATRSYSLPNRSWSAFVRRARRAAQMTPSTTTTTTTAITIHTHVAIGSPSVGTTCPRVGLPATQRAKRRLRARLLERVPGGDAGGERLVRAPALLEPHRLRADVAEVAGDLVGPLATAQHAPDALEVCVVGVGASRVVVDVLGVPVLDRHHAERGQPAGRPPAPPAEELHQFKVTHTAPPLAAMPRGNAPTGIGGPAWSVSGSTRTTVASPQATQTAPAP